MTAPPQETLAALDLVAHLRRQQAWSEATFGPGDRTAGNVAHIRKELAEIEADPADIAEWVDVILLALDGAWRAGWTPEEIAGALVAKQALNEARLWPDWRTAPRDKAIEHARPAAAPPPDATALQAAYERGRADERERCARIAAERPSTWGQWTSAAAAGADIAAAIREIDTAADHQGDAP